MIAETTILSGLDALAHRLIARVAPIQLSIAQSSIERAAAYRLRYQIAMDRAWASPSDFPNRQEHDAFDSRAIHIVARDSRQLAATCRLVFPEPGRLLPTEEIFGFVMPEPVVDIGRACVARAYSDQQHAILLALFARAWRKMRRHGLAVACAIVSPGAIRLYRRLGLEVAQLSPVRWHWGEQRAAILVSPHRKIL